MSNVEDLLPNYLSHRRPQRTLDRVVEQEEREATEVKRLAAAGKESCEVILRFLC
jgi:hypothetical protein